MFNIDKFRNIKIKDDRYSNQIGRILTKGYEKENIEKAVEESINNINNGCKSFVIYGEPQSGKTELMIALAARLLDEGNKKIIILVNDNVRLLNQNLDRFRKSKINPTPVSYAEILYEEVKDQDMIIFCKKNKNDLENLIRKIEGQSKLVIIDDEADYATPNGRVNKNDRTRINGLIHNLLSKQGVYIGVTATPARLDLNNTYNNLTEKWVRFKPHKHYIGMQEIFPMNGAVKSYNLSFLPDSDDSPKYLREALFSFLVNTSYLNCLEELPGNYSFLVHTSGNKVDHSQDYKIIIKTFEILLDKSHSKWDKYIEQIYKIALRKAGNKSHADIITEFIIQNISRKTVTVLNSDRKFDIDPTDPPSLYTIIIGGNIVSRGVTFKNLLGMFFTRDVKHKLQQDTYIQRARMFGDRKKYLKHFELSIPEYLYQDWRRCFVYHYLALKMIDQEKKAPIWMGDKRVQPVSTASIDRSTVNVNSGEMAFEKFQWNNDINEIANKISFENLLELNKLIGNSAFPLYIIDFIQSTVEREVDISILIREVGISANYHDTLLRERGAFGGEDIKRHSRAIHHILLLKNSLNEGRVIYKFQGQKVSILQNAK